MKAKKVVKFVCACIVSLCSGVAIAIVDNHVVNLIATDLAAWVES